MAEAVYCPDCGKTHQAFSLQYPGPYCRGDCRDGIACPFCKESGFDEVGLKIHLIAGHCEPFKALSASLPTTRSKP